MTLDTGSSNNTAAAQEEVIHRLKEGVRAGIIEGTLEDGSTIDIDSEDLTGLNRAGIINAFVGFIGAASPPGIVSTYGFYYDYPANVLRLRMPGRK